MSWFSKVAWTEGLFLRQQHFQQGDRYLEHLVEMRTRFASPYPWGFSALEIDRDLSQQNKFGLRRAAGVFADGTPFDLPGTSPLPQAVEIPEGTDDHLIWLALPLATPGAREVAMAEAADASRFVLAMEPVADTAAATVQEEELVVAHPRVTLEIRKTPKPGFNCIKLARIIEVRDKTVLLDEAFAPPVLATQAHAVVNGWLDRVIGWIDTRLETLARYASDPGSGGGLQAADYFMLQALNRQVGVLRHMRGSRYVHPVEFYQELLRLAGELWTLSPKRRAPSYPLYDHDALNATFTPLLDDIQRLLALDIGRATRLNLIQRRPDAYVAAVPDRSLFRNATFILEVAAHLPLTQIQQQIPALCKLGPLGRMSDIIQSHLPGIDLVHMPTPPRQIRSVSDHVYFYLDKSSPLWPDFSTDSSIGLQLAGNWPELQLDFWAIVEDRR